MKNKHAPFVPASVFISGVQNGLNYCQDKKQAKAASFLWQADCKNCFSKMPSSRHLSKRTANRTKAMLVQICLNADQSGCMQITQKAHQGRDYYRLYAKTPAFATEKFAQLRALAQASH